MSTLFKWLDLWVMWPIPSCHPRKPWFYPPMQWSSRSRLINIIWLFLSNNFNAIYLLKLTFLSLVRVYFLSWFCKTVPLFTLPKNLAPNRSTDHKVMMRCFKLENIYFVLYCCNSDRRILFIQLANSDKLQFSQTIHSLYIPLLFFQELATSTD